MLFTIGVYGNLHEVSNSIFWESKKKYSNMSSAEIFTQSAKR